MKGGINMVKLSVPDMHCEKCVERITKALSAQQLKFDISLAEHTVSIDGCDGCVSKALAALDDLGFSSKKL